MKVSEVPKSKLGEPITIELAGTVVAYETLTDGQGTRLVTIQLRDNESCATIVWSGPETVSDDTLPKDPPTYPPALVAHRDALKAAVVVLLDERPGNWWEFERLSKAVERAAELAEYKLPKDELLELELARDRGEQE